MIALVATSAALIAPSQASAAPLTPDEDPFYVYDGKLIGERIAELRRTLPPQVKLHYAMKANPMREVVSHVAAMVGFQ